MRFLVIDRQASMRILVRRAISAIDGIRDVAVVASIELAQSTVNSNSVDGVLIEAGALGDVPAEGLRRVSAHFPNSLLFVLANPSEVDSLSLKLVHATVHLIKMPLLDSMDASGSGFEVLKSRLMPGIGPYLRLGKPAQVAPLVSQTLVSKIRSNATVQLVLVASSTGGPRALEILLGRLKGQCRIPIIIVQHMPAHFTSGLAKHISGLTRISTAEARNNEFIEPQRIYVAPGGHHLTVVRQPQGIKIVLDDGPLVNSVRPAADRLFVSAAQACGAGCYGFVLTGMGEDARDGSIAVRDAGGKIAIQSQEDAVVWGMPGAVYEASAYDDIGDLAHLSHRLERLCG